MSDPRNGGQSPPTVLLNGTRPNLIESNGDGGTTEFAAERMGEWENEETTDREQCIDRARRAVRRKDTSGLQRNAWSRRYSATRSKFARPIPHPRSFSVVSSPRIVRPAELSKIFPLFYKLFLCGNEHQEQWLIGPLHYTIISSLALSKISTASVVSHATVVK